ncbi:MAG: ROK family protein [Candidatus Helarchaeota archaeon]|nr:ROK family protein [Candidatus Helarchaeota archaeon]
MEPEFVIGVDIGGTNIRAGTIDQNGKIISKSHRPVEHNKGQTGFEKNLMYCIKEEVDKLENIDDLRIGIGSPSPLNPITGFLHSPINVGCGEYPLKDRVMEKFNTKFVEVRNDLDAIALGYYNYGENSDQGRGLPYLAVIAPGTGLGSSILIEGKPYFGSSRSGFLALEHHKTPYFGSTLEEIKARIGKDFEDFTAGKGVISIYSKLFGCSKNPKIAELIENTAYEEKAWIINNFASNYKDEKFKQNYPKYVNLKDAICKKTYENVGKHLGYAIAAFVTNFNPDIVILEGSISNAYNIMKAEILNAYRKSVWEPHKDLPIVVGRLKDAGIKGASTLVR